MHPAGGHFFGKGHLMFERKPASMQFAPVIRLGAAPEAL
jgi:hypothetical protein